MGVTAEDKYIVRRCPVCGRIPHPGERIGFSSVHATCATKWNSWSFEKQQRAYDRVKEYARTR